MCPFRVLHNGSQWPLQAPFLTLASASPEGPREVPARCLSLRVPGAWTLVHLRRHATINKTDVTCAWHVQTLKANTDGTFVLVFRSSKKNSPRKAAMNLESSQCPASSTAPCTAPRRREVQTRDRTTRPEAADVSRRMRVCMSRTLVTRALVASGPCHRSPS